MVALFLDGFDQPPARCSVVMMDGDRFRWQVDSHCSDTRDGVTMPSSAALHICDAIPGSDKVVLASSSVLLLVALCRSRTRLAGYAGRLRRG